MATATLITFFNMVSHFAPIHMCPARRVISVLLNHDSQEIPVYSTAADRYR